MAVAFNPQTPIIVTTGGWADYVEFFLADKLHPDVLVETSDIRLMFRTPHQGVVDLSANCSKAGGRVSWIVLNDITGGWIPGDGAYELNVRLPGEHIDRWTFISPAKVRAGL
ncbi:hypothetical protein [Phenylobacterium sp.]|uniref:hypothetical protein n=1 Tax=Phenylobacterium sp. TaxID=1871053 RepID=UPI002F411F23